MAGKLVKDQKEILQMPLHELIEIIQSTNKKLELFLGSVDPLVDNRLKIILGAISDDDTTKIRTLFNTDGKIPVQDELIESDLNHYKRKCTNDASNSGNQSVLVEPAADSILEMFFVGMRNGDTVARTHRVYVRTSGGVNLGYLYTVNVDAAANYMWAGGLGTGHQIATSGILRITDAYEFLLEAQAIAISEDTDFFMLYKYIGDAPTITETGPTGSSWSNVS